MKGQIKIENGIQISTQGSISQRWYEIFAKMKDGDSFLIPKMDLVNNVKVAAYTYGKKHKIKFTVRKTDTGYRCWRVKKIEQHG